MLEAWGITSMTCLLQCGTQQLWTLASTMVHVLILNIEGVQLYSGVHVDTISPRCIWLMSLIDWEVQGRLPRILFWNVWKTYGNRINLILTTSQLLHGHKIRTLLGFVWPGKPGIGHSCACRMQFGFVKITLDCLFCTMDSQQYSSFVVWVQSIMQDSWLRP